MPAAAAKDADDADDAAAGLAARAEELVIGRRWREACEAVRAGEAVAIDRPHRSRALFGALGDAAALGAAAEAALSAAREEHDPTFPGFEHGRVLMVDPTGDDPLLTPQKDEQSTGGRPQAKSGGGAFATVAAALDAASDGDVLLLRPGTHRLTRSRDGEDLAVDKRVMITGSAPASARAKLYHCGNAPALRLRRPCVLRGLSLETDGFREAVLLEAGSGSGVLGKERLRQHARLGVPLALMWGCSVRSGGDDAAHVVGGGGAGAFGGGGFGGGGGGGSGAQTDGGERCCCDDALLVRCQLSAPSEGKGALVVAQGARVRAASGCSLGPCGGSGALVVGPSSALRLEGPGTAVEDCAGDGVVVLAGGRLLIDCGDVAVRRCGGAAVDASGARSSVSIGGGGGGGGLGGARLGEGCRGGALMLWDGAAAEVTMPGDGLAASELIGDEGGGGAFAVVVGPSPGSGDGGRAVVSCVGGGDGKGGGVGIIRGDAFVASSESTTVQALLRLGATRVVVSDAAGAKERARLPDPLGGRAGGGGGGGGGAFSPPPTKARFTPLSFS